MDVQARSQEEAVKSKRLASKIPPTAGQLVYSVCPPFTITAFYPDTDAGGRNVYKQPSQFMTVSCLEGPKGIAKYSEMFPKLVKEQKIFCIGRINKKLQVELSDEGYKHLQKMIQKWEW